MKKEEFIDWLWIRLREEPGLEKALNDLHSLYRAKMEREVLEKLREIE